MKSARTVIQAALLCLETAFRSGMAIWTDLSEIRSPTYILELIKEKSG